MHAIRLCTNAGGTSRLASPRLASPAHGAPSSTHYSQKADRQGNRSNLCILAYGDLALYTVQVRAYQRQLPYIQTENQSTHKHFQLCAQPLFNSILLGRGEDPFFVYPSGRPAYALSLRCDRQHHGWPLVSKKRKMDCSFSCARAAVSQGETPTRDYCLTLLLGLCVLLTLSFS